MKGMEFPFSKPLDTANRFSCLENLTTEREYTQVPSDREYSAAVKSQGFSQRTSSRSIRQNKAIALDKRDGDWENSWTANSKTTSENKGDQENLFSQFWVIPSLKRSGDKTSMLRSRIPKHQSKLSLVLQSTK